MENRPIPTKEEIYKLFEAIAEDTEFDHVALENLNDYLNDQGYEQFQQIELPTEKILSDEEFEDAVWASAAFAIKSQERKNIKVVKLYHILFDHEDEGIVGFIDEFGLSFQSRPEMEMGLSLLLKSRHIKKEDALDPEVKAVREKGIPKEIMDKYAVEENLKSAKARYKDYYSKRRENAEV